MGQRSRPLHLVPLAIENMFCQRRRSSEFHVQNLDRD